MKLISNVLNYVIFSLVSVLSLLTINEFQVVFDEMRQHMQLLNGKITKGALADCKSFLKCAINVSKDRNPDGINVSIDETSIGSKDALISHIKGLYQKSAKPLIVASQRC